VTSVHTRTRTQEQQEETSPSHHQAKTLSARYHKLAYICRGLNEVGLERLTYSEGFYYHHNHPCIQWLITLAETVTNRAVGDGLKTFNWMVIITDAFLPQITSCEGDKIWLKTLGIFRWCIYLDCSVYKEWRPNIRYEK
jgi:hypothetical protein